MFKLYKFAAIFALFGLLAAGSISAQPPDWPIPIGRPDSPERTGVFVGSFGKGPYYPSWRSIWPVAMAPLITTKLATTADADGRISGDRDDPFTHRADPSFEFPAGSGVQYLFGSYLIFGGVLDGDTLASNQVSFNNMGGIGSHEFFPPENPQNRGTLTPIDIGAGTAYRTVRVDTFTYPTYGNLAIAWDPVRQTFHKPLHLRVIQKTYTCDLPLLQNMVLLDYTVTNIGASEIHDGWVGMLLDPWAGAWSKNDYNGSSYDDDLMGGIRGVASAYIIDNDGDPSDGYFHQGQAAVDGLGFRATMMYPPPTDTNFNWWYSTYWALDIDDFGPRQRPTPDDPWYDLPNGYLGFPDGDVCWHYVLSHREWDYDQVRAASIQPDDSVWMYPENRSLVTDIANGADCDALLSLGPFDLLPDSSMRVIFAMFGADFIHNDPTNGEYLAAGEYDLYFSNLNFSVFRQRATDAVAATDYLLGPQSPPTGLHPTYLSADTVRLTWDPRVFPDIKGYNVYLTPVADSFYIAQRVVRPGAEPDRVVPAATTAPGKSEVELTGLDPAKFYFASVAHETDAGPGRRSPSVVVGYGNRALVPDTVRMKRYHTFYLPDDTGVVLSWFPAESPDIAWYRIYKTSDSTQAQERYQPFLAIDSGLSPVIPRRAGTTDGRPWCYYRILPYDSVPAPQTGYIDTRISTDGWYWVTAVNKYGDESPFSHLVSASLSTPPTQDLLVVLSSMTSLHDWVKRDSLFAFYDRLLDGYDYDIYSWADTNRNVHSDDIDYNVNWLDFARYRVILIEEMTSPGVLTRWNEPAYHTLERIIASGRDLVYFGTPPGPLDLNLNTNKSVIRYDPRSFEAGYFHLDSARLCTWQGLYRTYGVADTLAGFDHAVPQQLGLPALTIDADADRLTGFMNTLFAVDGYLPLTPAFYPDSTAEVLYWYGSKYPSSSLLDGLPCGLLNRQPGSNVYTFAFHLWAMDSGDARRLIDYILDRQAPDDDLAPYFLPSAVSLDQNYPNPFNPSTTIDFELEHGHYVTLEVFDLLGRTTTTLIDRELAAGPHSVEWDGRDKSGRRVASGIYFYRLTTGDGSRCRKMVLVK